MSESILTVDNLSTQFKRADDMVYAVNGVSFSVRKGETLGIVGESGSGKSVSILSILRLLKGDFVVQGRTEFLGSDLLKLTRRQMDDIRGRDIGVVFQDPMTSLTPTMRVGQQIIEGMVAHKRANKREAMRHAIRLLDEVGIPDPEIRIRNYPFEFSGGMRQRVMIALAIACEPQLLIADEPTTALDVTVQMQILSLLQNLRQKRNMSIIMITHDFGVATNFCDRIMVMYSGKVMESAPLEEFLQRPAHPYTLGLKSSIIEVSDDRKQLHPIPGAATPLTAPPSHCPFAERCFMAEERCHKELPRLRQIDMEHGPDHWVACHLAEEVMNNVR